MAKGRNLHIPCDTCGAELNTWDVRACKALGYKKVLVCEKCMKYTNQKEVDALQSYLYGIDSTLELTAFSTRHGSGENTAISAGLYIAEKGNKPIIQRLLRDGFRKVIRQKISTGIGSDFYMVHLEHTLECKPDRMSDGTDGLLQHGLCPYEYQCFTSDCMECVKIRSGELTKK